MRTHQTLQTDGWRAKGHPFPWVQPSLMPMVLPLVAVTCMPHSARLRPYLNLFTWGLTMFIPLWDWSAAEPFPLTSDPGSTRMGATVLCCLSSCPPWSHPMGRPWFLCKRKAAHRWVLGVFTVFICLAQLKTSPGARLEGMCALNEPEPFDWRGESSALILFCSLQSFAHSSVSMGVLHTHSALGEKHSRRYWRIPAWDPLVSSECKQGRSVSPSWLNLLGSLWVLVWCKTSLST